MHAVLAKLLATKVLAATVSAASVGGVAVAAAAGALPEPVQNVAHDVVGAPAMETPEVPEVKPTAAAEPTDPAEAPETAETADGPETLGPTAAAHPSLKGLCHAYVAGNKATHGKARQSTAFSVLVTAAGGKDGVLGYCAQLTGVATDAAKTDTATQPKAGKAHKPEKAQYPKHPKNKKAEKSDDAQDNGAKDS